MTTKEQIDMFIESALSYDKFMANIYNSIPNHNYVITGEEGFQLFENAKNLVIVKECKKALRKF